jgi:hypothetical protein
MGAGIRSQISLGDVIRMIVCEISYAGDLTGTYRFVYYVVVLKIVRVWTSATSRQVKMDDSTTNLPKALHSRKHWTVKMLVL